MTDFKKYNILYVDDEQQNLVSFKAAFRPYYRIFTALGATEGIEILRSNHIHLIITDQRMPEVTGVELLKRIIPEFPDAVRMVLTGFTDMEDIILAINSGKVFHYITKPWNEEELKATIDQALTFYRKQMSTRDRLEELEKKVSAQEETIDALTQHVPEETAREILGKSGAEMAE